MTQRDQGPEVYEGRLIAAVELLEHPGDERLDLSAPLTGEARRLAENQVRSAPGGIFRAELLESDLARLNRLGRFGRIDGYARLNSDGSVDVFFAIEPQAPIVDVLVEGNERVRASDLAGAVELLRGGSADRFQLDRAAREIEQIYRERGYGQVVVDWRREETDAGGVRIIFRVTEGDRIRVTRIRFEGNRDISDRLLRGQINLRESELLRKTPFDDTAITSDIERIAEYYRSEGYLDVRVDRAPPIISPNGREAIVTFLINEGPVCAFRSVQIVYLDQEPRGAFRTRAEAEAAREPGEEIFFDPSGEYVLYRAEPFSSQQIAGMFESLKPGDAYRRQLVRQGIARIELAFGELGYVGVSEASGSLRLLELRDPTDATKVDLLLIARAGRKQLVGEIKVSTGPTTITKLSEVLRLVSLRPGRPLSTTRIRESESLLRRSQLFETRDVTKSPSISVQPEDPALRGFRDLFVQVHETQTANLGIGATVSSDGGLIGNVSYTERNFDIADFPTSPGELFSLRAFRGGGQTFAVEALPGTAIQTYRISLSDPSLFDSTYTGSASFQLRNRIFREFDEERLSLNLGIGRRFGSRWVGRVDMRFENIDISEINERSSTDLFAVEGKSTITGVALQLTRSTIDSIANPSRGTRVSLAAEQIGLLGGDYQFTKLRAEGVAFLTLDRDFLGRLTTLRLSGDVAYIPQGQDEAPLFERFYRGGGSFRGFDFRSVSPKGVRNDTGERSRDTVGGIWEIFLGAQVKFPLLSEELSGVVFVDTGTVTDSIGFDDYRVSAGFGFRLLTPISPIPIAFDFGFPILKADGDRERVFTFSIDLPF